MQQMFAVDQLGQSVQQQMYGQMQGQMQQVQQVQAQQQAPAPPQKLTDGFPDPVAVEQQKVAYAKSLEQQLKAQSEEVAKRSDSEKQALVQQAAQSKAHFNLQIDTALQQQARALDEQTNAQMLALQEAAVQQKSTLEGQAAGLKLEFEQKKAQEDMMIRQYEIQKKYYEANQKLQAQLQQVAPQQPQQVQGPPPAMMLQPSSTMVASPYPQGMMTMPGS